MSNPNDFKANLAAASKLAMIQAAFGGSIFADKELDDGAIIYTSLSFMLREIMPIVHQENCLLTQVRSADDRIVTSLVDLTTGQSIVDDRAIMILNPLSSTELVAAESRTRKQALLSMMGIHHDEDAVPGEKDRRKEFAARGQEEEAKHLRSDMVLSAAIPYADRKQTEFLIRLYDGIKSEADKSDERATEMINHFFSRHIALDDVNYRNYLVDLLNTKLIEDESDYTYKASSNTSAVDQPKAQTKEELEQAINDAQSALDATLANIEPKTNHAPARKGKSAPNPRKPEIIEG